MALDPKFGPAAQTPAARAIVLARMMRALPYLSKPLSTQVLALYQRYLAGELSWLQVYEAREKLPTPQTCKQPLPKAL